MHGPLAAQAAPRGLRIGFDQRTTMLPSGLGSQAEGGQPC